MKVLFTYLTSFSGHGGIEKFNKSFIKTLDECKEVTALKVISLHDNEKDKNYIENASFSSFRGRKFSFLIFAIKEIFKKYDVIFIGHINLALIAVVAKLICPSTKIIIITHGIDIWMPLNGIKKWALKKAYKILSVSYFTRSKLIDLYQIPEDKITVFHNTIDPFIVPPDTFAKPEFLLSRYKLSKSDHILTTICRLSSNEAYKGCDRVISCLPEVLKNFPDTKYLIIGKYDQDEKLRLDALIKQFGVSDHVIFSGFVPEEELMAHYLLGDLFIMPSINEGFGIVYIEAMASGVPVIAGKLDGSVDALDNGNLGLLVDPHNTDEIVQAIEKILSQPKDNHPIKADLQKRVYKKFGFENYKKRLTSILKEIEDVRD